MKKVFMIVAVLMALAAPAFGADCYMPDEVTGEYTKRACETFKDYNIVPSIFKSDCLEIKEGFLVPVQCDLFNSPMFDPMPLPYIYPDWGCECAPDEETVSALASLKAELETARGELALLREKSKNNRAMILLLEKLGIVQQEQLGYHQEQLDLHQKQLDSLIKALESLGGNE
jgi:hypothetical protein